MEKIYKNLNLYRKVFDMFYTGSDKYWRITLDDLKEAFKLLMISNKKILEAEDYINKIRSQEDENEKEKKNNTSDDVLIDFDEFVYLIARFNDSSIESVLHEAFAEFDKNKEGKISKEDLLELPQRIEYNDISDTEIEGIISDANFIDENGNMKYNEYIEFYNTNLNE